MLGNVVNPSSLYVEEWSGYEYMVIWSIVIIIMAILGKSMISYEEDVVDSKGCNMEVTLAEALRMNVVRI